MKRLKHAVLLLAGMLIHSEATAKQELPRNRGASPVDFGLEQTLSGTDWTIASFEPGAGVEARAYAEGYPTGAAIQATVPGDVHWDLERAGKIPDPHYGTNSRQSRWAATKEWWYRKTFSVRKDWKGKAVRLHFDAVDYEADVWLNGEKLGRHEGQFTPFTFDATKALNWDRENVLVVWVHAAPKLVTDTIAKSNRVSHEKDGGDSTGNVWATLGAIRSQYPYWKSMTNSGWDWGFELVSMGIWQDVRLIASERVCLSKLTVLPDVPAPYDRATLRIGMDVNAGQPGAVTLRSTVRSLTSEAQPAMAERVIKVAAGQQSVTAEMVVDNPRLWWPNGYGEQHLYHLEVVALDGENGAILSAVSTRFGIRELVMLANPLADDYTCYRHWNPQGVVQVADPKPELKYLMRINGKKIMGMGASWVPCDMMFGRPGREFHEHLVRLAAEANFNLFRVNGCGLIDKQVFFDLCDEYGIMLFAEFPNAGPRLPEDDKALAITASETRQILPLLMNHPCVVRYGGGNEWYLTAEQSKQMAQLRRICNEMDPTRPYHDPDPETFAQRHGQHWYYIHPKHPDQFYRVYNTGYPLSGGPDNPIEWTEYGAGGASSVETLKRIMPSKSLWPIKMDDPYWAWHNGLWAFMGPNWLAPDEYRYLFGELPDVETEVRCSQFVQAEGLRYANQSHRRHQWHRSAFVSWSYNEPWPNAAHGCIVEHYGKTKMAYDYARQACAPVDISAVYDNLVLNPGDPLRMEVWVSSILDKPLADHKVRRRIWDTRGTLWVDETETVRVPANHSAEVMRIEWKPAGKMNGAAAALVYLELLEPGGKAVAANLYTFGWSFSGITSLLNCSYNPEGLYDSSSWNSMDKPALQPMLHAAVTTLALSLDGGRWRDRAGGGKSCAVRVRNTGGNPALFVELRAETPENARVYYEANRFFLPPGETRHIEVDLAPKDGKPIASVPSVSAKAWNTPAAATN